MKVKIIRYGKIEDNYECVVFPNIINGFLQIVIKGSYILIEECICINIKYIDEFYITENN